MKNTYDLAKQSLIDRKKTFYFERQVFAFNSRLAWREKKKPYVENILTHRITFFFSFWNNKNLVSVFFFLWMSYCRMDMILYIMYLYIFFFSFFNLYRHITITTFIGIWKWNKNKEGNMMGRKEKHFPCSVYEIVIIMLNQRRYLTTKGYVDVEYV